MASQGLPSAEFLTQVGARLRAVREQRHLTLKAVEELSNGEFTAGSLGAYERGRRTISLPRLRALANVYDLPVDELMIDQRPSALSDGEESEGRPQSLRLNLSALRASTSPEATVVRNFIERVRVERHDYDGRALTIRIDDLRVLGAGLGMSETELLERLDDLLLLVRPRR